MSLNELINPVKPLDIIVNDLTVEGDINTGSISLLRAGGDISPSTNVDAIISQASPFIIIDEKIIDFDATHPTARYRTYSSGTIQIQTPISIDPANLGTFKVRLSDPVITPDWKKINTLCNCGGVVDVSGTNMPGNFFLSPSPLDSSSGYIELDFVSVFGELKPSTIYILSFQVSVAYLP